MFMVFVGVVVVTVTVIVGGDRDRDGEFDIFPALVEVLPYTLTGESLTNIRSCLTSYKRTLWSAD